MVRPVSSASCCSDHFQSRRREPLEPPAIGGDHEAAHPEITRPADPIEPEPNAVDGELPGIMVEIVGVDLDRPTLRAIVAAAVLELAEQFLLFRVDRYHRPIVGLKLLDLGVDIFELSVAIGMF